MRKVIENTNIPAGAVNGPKTIILFARIFAITAKTAIIAMGYSTPYFFPRMAEIEDTASVITIHNVIVRISIILIYL